MQLFVTRSGSVTGIWIIQIKICVEYRDVLPRPRLVCQEPGLRPIGRSPGVPDESSRGLGSMSRYSAQILICLHFPFFTRGQFWPSGVVIACVCVSVRVSVCVYQSLACPHDNSSAVHARITKFGWETQNTLVKMPIIFGGDRPWPSRSNLTWKSNFTSFHACPHDNFSLV